MGVAAARITYVGHATVLVDMDGVRLLTDPLVRPRLLHLRRVGTVDADVLRGVDAVLISHLHFDHLDIQSVKRLGRDTPIVVPRGAGSLLTKKGFGSVTELGVGEEIRIGGVVIRGTPALHQPGRIPLGRRVEPMGYVIAGSRSVYFAGDTDVFDGMAALGPVDVALVPIWGWGPSLGPGHMDPRSAAEAARILRASIAIPIHWGTYFPLQTALRGAPAFIDAPPGKFLACMREVAPDIEVRVLRPGDQTNI
jgi:L-ascorbate metabolism protein UlaG (beta-lactamase superfamily)